MIPQNNSISKTLEESLRLYNDLENPTPINFLRDDYRDIESRNDISKPVFCNTYQITWVNRTTGLRVITEIDAVGFNSAYAIFSSVNNSVCRDIIEFKNINV